MKSLDKAEDAMPEHVDVFVGKTLGNCTLERLLGRGGMGAVYLAQQQRPTRRVAVKILQPQDSAGSQHFEEFLQRFRREADVIARLEHVNITPIYEYGEQEEEQLAYLVMPYVSGGSLRERLARQGKFSLTETLTYGEQIAAALDYAHAQGILHRDLKPSNFLLHPDGRLVLADFGIARILETQHHSVPTLTSTGIMPGTPEYMAPEMIQGREIDHRADIYEFGIVLYQLLSGRLPYSGTNLYALAISHVQKDLPTLREQRPDLPQAIDEVLRKATAKQPEERYNTAQALIQDLKQIEANLASHSDQYEPSTLPSAQRSEVAPTTPAQAAIPQSQWHTPTPPTQWASTPATGPAQMPENQQVYPAQPYPTPYPVSQPPQPPRQARPWWPVTLLLAAALLLVGGIVIGQQFARNNTTSSNTNNTPPATTVTAMATVTSPATSVPTATATTKPTQTPATSQVPHGALIYQTNKVGEGCDSNGGTWNNYNGINIACSGGHTTISNTTSSAQLQGTFLTQIHQQSYGSDYVIEAQIQQNSGSSNDFGLYFRNQPGQQQGVYTLLIHPGGTWNAYVYNNSTGAPTVLTGGSLGDAHAPVKLAVVVKGQSFSFYANGHKIGSISNATYSIGTAGIAVDTGGSITVSQFTLYRP